MRRIPYDGPFALSLRAGNADHLHCLNDAAEAQGLRRGMALADARAIYPRLVTRPADLAAEAAVLAALVRMAGRWSPYVAADATDGLVADIGGVAHLFGDEEGLLGDLDARFGRAGFACRAGLADTRGAAHALARHGGGIAASGQLLAALGPLPPAALRIDHETAEGLGRLGLQTIRDLTQIPRVTLARRFGPALMLRLDQALGDQPEPIAAGTAPPHYGVRLTLPEPIGLISDVMAGLARLLDRLCEQLAAHQHGARRLRLELRRVSGTTAQAEIGLARPMRDPRAMAALFARAVDEIDAGFGIDQLRLTAPVVETLAPVQLSNAREGQAAGKLADLITRLGNRVGFDNVIRYLPADSHIPERSFQIASAAYSQPSTDWPGRGPVRPLVLFRPEPIVAPITTLGSTPPMRFRWRRMTFSTSRTTGPERITPEWWFDDPAWRTGLRDYWKVETYEGRRLWLFHTPQAPGWCVQGEFA